MMKIEVETPLALQKHFYTNGSFIDQRRCHCADHSLRPDRSTHQEGDRDSQNTKKGITEDTQCVEPRLPSPRRLFASQILDIDADV